MRRVSSPRGLIKAGSLSFLCFLESRRRHRAFLMYGWIFFWAVEAFTSITITLLLLYFPPSLLPFSMPFSLQVTKATNMACSSAAIMVFVLCVLLSQSFTALSVRQPWQMTRTSARSKKPLVLSLSTRKIPSSSLPRQPNKLRFHHNVSLIVSLAVGTPPQNVSMVLDTGSELSWLLCNSSLPSKPSFQPNLSSTYSPLPCSSQICQSQTRDLPIPADCDSATNHCHVSLSYADGSTSDGSLASDIFVAGESRPLKTNFGCMGSIYSSSGEDPVTAGLLGMNRGALSFVTQTATRRFSYCISDRDSSGVLLIGESSLPFLLPLNYTPLVQVSLPLPYFDRVAYSVQLEGIRVANTLLPIPKSVLVPDHTGAGQTMVDSGTQFTFLLGPAYDALKAEFSRQTRGVLTVLNEPDYVFQGAFDSCFRIREGASPPASLPEVVLMFRGAEVRVAGERLLYRVAGEARGGDGVWCFTFGNSDLVPMEAYVIGHHHQQNVWVEYDLENGRVGFAPVQCDLASQRLGLVL